jgi:hypothetical protein
VSTTRTGRDIRLGFSIPSIEVYSFRMAALSVGEADPSWTLQWPRCVLLLQLTLRCAGNRRPRSSGRLLAWIEAERRRMRGAPPLVEVMLNELWYTATLLVHGEPADRAEAARHAEEARKKAQRVQELSERTRCAAMRCRSSLLRQRSMFLLQRVQELQLRSNELLLRSRTALSAAASR